jgi:hypothetical protein
MALQETYIRHRRALRAAVTSKDPARILRAVKSARASFEREGYPDAWMDWPRAAEDAATRCSVDGTRDYSRRDALGDTLACQLRAEASAWR